MKPVQVMFFCLGNICRSPIAEGVFAHEVQARSLTHIHTDSAGTSNYHAGEPPHPGSQQVIKRRLGTSIAHQQAQQLTRHHLKTIDYLVALDAQNRRDALKIHPEARIFLLRDFDPEGPGDVPDPWGKDDSAFDLVFDMIARSVPLLVDHIQKENP